MKTASLFHSLMAVATLAAVSAVVASPVLAQDNKMSGSKMSSTKTTKKVNAAKVYACQHCKMTYTAVDAKKHNFKCCGKALVKIKATKKSDTTKKS